MMTLPVDDDPEYDGDIADDKALGDLNEPLYAGTLPPDEGDAGPEGATR
jgi:hypothetical protein